MPHLLLKDVPPLECLQESAKEFPELDATAAEAFLNLLHASDQAFAVAEQSLTAAGISQGRFCVMMLLWRSNQPEVAANLTGRDACAPGPRTPAELAEAAGVTRATMTGLIDTLERDGFVKRQPDKTDRRMMSVLLTAKGEQFLRRFMPGHFKVTCSLMSGLSVSERKTLVRLLSKVQHQAAALQSGAAPMRKSA
jgi:DNA-binding MarR family transcriptional regulator